MIKNVKNIILLQGVVIIYTISGIMSKNASASGDRPVRLILFLGLDLMFLGIYAILWQQMIKRFELSVAYANRSMAILWSMIWAFVFFHDDITVKNIIGVLLVAVGTFIINTDTCEKTDNARRQDND